MAESDASKQTAELQEEGGEGDMDELNVDPDGRVACAGNQLLDFRFRSFANVFAKGVPETLRADCQTVFTARDAGKSKYSSGDTFWVPVSADVTQLSQLEQIVLDVFHFHTKAAQGHFDLSTSGAEWWTQCVRPIDDIGFHWDRDYSLEDSGIALHPLIATVTYLGDLGGPTLVVQKRAPLSVEESVLGPVATTSSFLLSRPRTGKHMSFDGRLLHAAPGNLAKLWGGADTGTRMTLLVNVWLNWKPRDAEPLSKEIRAKLKPSVESTPVLAFESSEPTQIMVSADVKVEEEVYNFRADVPVQLRLPVPVSLLKQHFAELKNEPHSVVVSYSGVEGARIEPGVEEDEGDEGEEGDAEVVRVPEPRSKRTRRDDS